MALTVKQVIIAILLSSVVIFLTRLLPFLLFSKKNPPRIIKFIEKYVPQMIIAVLVVYCFKDVEFAQNPYGLPFLISCAVVVVLHLTLKNSMISILGGTVLFIILSRLFS